MKKHFFSVVVATLLSTSALADTASMNPDVAGMGILQNEWVRAGVNGDTGTLGSGGSTSPGLLFDPTGAGTFNPSYDYLTPGSPFDGFSLKVDGENKTNNNAGGGGLGIVKDNFSLTNSAEGVNTLSWAGVATMAGGDWFIENHYTLMPNKPYIDITTQIENQSPVTAEHVWFAKFIDPDSQGMPGDSSSTDNVLGYGIIPSTNVAFSEATTSRYALGIYTTNTNVTAGINGWSTQADGYNGTSYTDADGNPVNYGNSDDTIGISWHWTNVAPGDILTANYAYIFGPSAFTAADSAITGGAGGGDTTTTSSWGTLTDVGSATDAAESGASGGGSTTPTVTGTTTTTITSTSEAVSTTLPVLTASITHHTASDDGKVQTVARERTTSVTTPVEVTTTSFDRTVTSYSDGTSATTDGATTSTTAIRNDTVTTVTDPGSFVGRIDQMATADKMLSMANRSLSFDGINAVGTMNKADNGMSGGVAGVTFGGTKDLDNGWSIGAGAGRLGARVRDVGSANVESTLLNLHGGRSIEQGAVNFSLTHAMNDYTSSRTIGDFANSSKTSGTDTWANVTFTGNGETIRPVLGITRGIRSVDGYAEAGSIQSARTVADSSEWYTFGTIGAQATLVEGVTLQGLHHTDGVNSLSLGVNKEIEKDVTVVANVSRNMSRDQDANSIGLGLLIKF